MWRNVQDNSKCHRYKVKSVLLNPTFINHRKHSDKHYLHLSIVYRLFIWEI